MTSHETGWYRDPHDPLRHRYWTGERWQSECERLRDLGHGHPCPKQGAEPA